MLMMLIILLLADNLDADAHDAHDADAHDAHDAAADDADDADKCG